jgi:hypothetical protein
MGNLVSYNFNLNTPTSGTFDRGNISYATSSFIESGSFGLMWGYEVYSVDGYTFITDSYTQSFSPSSSATPIFYLSETTSSVDVLDTVNRLPDRANQPLFTNANSALNWISGSGKYITLLTGSIYTASVSFLLQTNGSYLLQTNGDRIILNI